MIFYKRILALCLSTMVFLTGCNSPVYNQSEANVADVKLRENAAKAHMADLGKPNPTLIINQGLYVDKTPINFARRPPWLQNRVVLRGEQLPFSYYNRTILEGGSRNILTHYQSGLNDKAMVSIDYSGSVKGALDLLAAKTGYIYSVSGNDVYWQAYVTRTFDIAFMPGSSDYLMGKASGSEGGGGAAGSPAAGPGGGTVTGTIDDSAGSQYSNLKGTLSIWKDLETSIKQLLSPDGKVVVSEATTTVTVRDRPTNVNLISRFINNVNNNLSRQVLVKVEILTVTLENDFNFGINWQAIEHAFGNGQYRLISNNGAPIALTSSVTQLNLNMTQAGVFNALTNNANQPLAASGIQSLINALQQQGKVSLVTQPQVLCQNNQVSQIRIVDQAGYLASIQSTSLAGGAGTTGSAAVTSQITPGAVVTGLTLYVLPKILGNRIYLQVNADLSNNLGFQTIGSNGQQIVQGQSQPAGTTAIQVPNLQQKQFNQRGVIASGDTLILAGFRQTSNRVGAEQLFNSQALGGRTAAETDTETLVLITPIILRGIA